jgi:hypothetical protein
MGYLWQACIDTGPLELDVLEQPEVSPRELFADITDDRLKHGSFLPNRSQYETQQILIPHMAA